MDRSTKGAWLLSQSKNLDAFMGAGPARLENISFSGRVGRLYNLLRRNINGQPTPTIDAATVTTICQLNNIDKPSRLAGIRALQNEGRIDVAKNGSISVLGATSKSVLEFTADIFAQNDPTIAEEAAIELSEQVAHQPVERTEAIEQIGDLYKMLSKDVSTLVDLCRSAALIDEEEDRDRTILFNSNLFRHGQSARKALLILEGLSASDRRRLEEIQDQLAKSGTLHDRDVRHGLGRKLYDRLVSVGFLDRMEVSNPSESVGYITSPTVFQKYGRPFEEDPIDDAKALLASLTYGMTRSQGARGRIILPEALLRALIAGREVGGNYGVRAIGEDYRELEHRQVVKVTPHPHDPSRYTFRLLKKDVGEIALAIVQHGSASEEAILIDKSPATSFKGPHANRVEVRRKSSIEDRRAVFEVLEPLRTDG